MHPPVTIVIPTLGDSDLKKIIQSINHNSIIPSEILICIPKQFYFKVKNIKEDNVTILCTDTFGQVPQRIQGFKEAKTEYVIQLDDDVRLEKNSIKELLSAIISKGEKSSVGPYMIDLDSRQSVHKNKLNFLKKIYYLVINSPQGFLPGTITKAGTCIGIDAELSKKDLIETEWLSGGMVIHNKNNLILENYFPFKGKAYSEDLIHSHLMKEIGLKLYICKRSICYIEAEKYLHQKTLREFLNWLIGDFRARKYYVIMSKKNQIYLYIHYLKEISQYLLFKLLSIFNIK